MITITEVPARAGRDAYVRARLVLSNGTVAGEGYAGTVDNAIYFAIVDARDAGYRDAANGHAKLFPHIFHPRSTVARSNPRRARR